MYFIFNIMEKPFFSFGLPSHHLYHRFVCVSVSSCMYIDGKIFIDSQQVREMYQVFLNRRLFIWYINFRQGKTRCFVLFSTQQTTKFTPSLKPNSMYKMYTVNTVLHQVRKCETSRPSNTVVRSNKVIFIRLKYCYTVLCECVWISIFVCKCLWVCVEGFSCTRSCSLSHDAVDPPSWQWQCTPCPKGVRRVFFSLQRRCSQRVSKRSWFNGRVGRIH